MKILSNYHNNSHKSKCLAFKSNENDNVIAYDDEISKSRRKYIREHYASWNIPYQSIYETEPMLEAYPLNQLISNLANKPKNIDSKSILNLPLCNVRNIGGTNRFQPNIYRGQTLFEAPDYCIESIKKAGINTVIDLVGYGEDYKNRINAKGMDYMYFDINSYYHSYHSTSNLPKNYIENLIKFIKKIQEEYVYIACEYGTYKTDKAIMLNKIFNPKIGDKFCPISSLSQIGIPINFINIYNKLTQADKINLGWDEKFEKYVISKIKKFH